MKGHYEIDPVVVKLNNVDFTITGYYEDANNIKYADAYYTGRFGNIVSVKYYPTKILLMDALEIQRKKDLNKAV